MNTSTGHANTDLHTTGFSNPLDMMDLYRAAQSLVREALQQARADPTTTITDPALVRNSALFDLAVAVLTTRSCLRRATSGDPATVPGPNGENTTAEVVAYWTDRLRDAHTALNMLATQLSCAWQSPAA